MTLSHFGFWTIGLISSGMHTHRVHVTPKMLISIDTTVPTRYTNQSRGARGWTDISCLGCFFFCNTHKHPLRFSPLLSITVASLWLRLNVVSVLSPTKSFCLCSSKHLAHNSSFLCDILVVIFLLPYRKLRRLAERFGFSL